MEKWKNLIVSIAGIALILFIADVIIAKYNLDPNEPTCINNDVQSLLIQVTTEDLQQKLLKDGYKLSIKSIKENTTTQQRDFTYKGKSKYACNTSLAFSLSAIVGKKNAEEIIALIPKEDLIKTLDRDYTVTQNDIGTTYYVSALKISEENLQDLYGDEFLLAAEKLKEKHRKNEEQKIKKVAVEEPIVNQATIKKEDSVNNTIILPTISKKNLSKILNKGIIYMDEQWGDLGLYETLRLEGNGEKCEITILGGLKNKGGTCKTSNNSKGIKIYCTKNRKICKTEKEFFDFLNLIYTFKNNSDTLPFIGKKTFNFTGGNGTSETLTIKENGDTYIQMHGLAHDPERHIGKFKNPLKDGDTIYFVTENNIAMIDKNGDISTGCYLRNDDTLCIDELFDESKY